MSTPVPWPKPSLKALGTAHLQIHLHEIQPRHAGDLPEGTPARVKVRRKGAPKEDGEIHEGTRKLTGCPTCGRRTA